MEYRVYFVPNGSFSATVEIPDDEIPEDESELTDLIIDKAYDIVPHDVCFQCGGWDKPWSLDFGDPEVQAVEDAEGNVLYEEK